MYRIASERDCCSHFDLKFISTSQPELSQNLPIFFKMQHTLGPKIAIFCLKSQTKRLRAGVHTSEGTRTNPKVYPKYIETHSRISTYPENRFWPIFGKMYTSRDTNRWVRNMRTFGSYAQKSCGKLRKCCNFGSVKNHNIN